MACEKVYQITLEQFDEDIPGMLVMESSYHCGIH